MLFHYRIALVCLGLGISSALFAADPAWWTAPGTVILDNRPGISHAVSENYAPANLGQLKNVAKRAKAHLDANLPGGAGATINALVAGFQNNNPAENYAPINLGQLKAVTKPFYDRLIATGYNTQSNLVAHGFTGAGAYPWNPSTAVSENYALANLGQLKMAFSFDVTGFTPVDTDGDGLPDPYETYLGSNANDYFSQGANTIVPRIFVYGGGGAWVASGQYSDGPIIYKVVNKATGVALANAPVTIAVTAGPGKVSTATGGAATTTVTVRTDAQGLAKAFFKAP